MTGKWLRSGTLALAMTFTAAGVYAQGPSRDEDTHPPDRADANHKTSQDVQKKFAEDMFLTNFAEVQLGRLGVQHATSPDVKSFAQMMVAEHTKANQELTPIAQQFGVQPPVKLDAKHQAIADRLSKLQGAEFDKEFMQAMVQAHEEATAKIAPVAGVISADAGSRTGGSTTGPVPSSSGSGSQTTGTSGSGSGSEATGTSGSGSGAGSSASHAGAASAGSSSGSHSAGTAAMGPVTTIEQYATKTLASVNQHLQQARQLESGLTK
jgi:putative membrane protein